jgi:hypothetical protein
MFRSYANLVSGHVLVDGGWWDNNVPDFKVKVMNRTKHLAVSLPKRVSDKNDLQRGAYKSVLNSWSFN